MIFSSALPRRLFSAFLILTVLALPLSVAASEPVSSESDLIGGEDSGLINILLVGQDRREEDTPARADTIILCTFHPETKSVLFTSFLRDLYVQIPGIGGNRLNAAYAYGGAPLLRDTLQESLSIHTDGTIEVDFSQFAQIIDALGGVTLELRQDEASVINQTVEGSLSEGLQSLTGAQALAYTRIRKLDDDGDFSRTERQRKVLTALLDRYRDAGFLKILSAVADILPLISTDLEGKDILRLAAKLFPMLQEPAVVSQRIPADGSYTYSTIRGMEVLTADLEEAREQLRTSISNLYKKPHSIK